MPYKREYRVKNSDTGRKEKKTVWWISYTTASGTVRESSGSSDFEYARRLEQQKRGEHAARRGLDTPGDYLFDHLVIRYLSERKAAGRSIERDTYSAQIVAVHFQGRQCTEISGQDISAYTAARRASGIKDNTILRELGFISAAFNHAINEWNWPLRNPVKGRKPGQPPAKERWLTRAEADALIQSARQERNAPYLPAFIILALHTGARSGELLGLEWSSVDLSRAVIRFVGHNDETAGTRRAKTMRARTVPLNGQAMEAIRELIGLRREGSRWVFCHQFTKGTKTGGDVNPGDRVSSIKKSFSTACKRAGLEGVTPHTLRHTCASWLAQAGIPMIAIGAMLGQSVMSTTARYSHYGDDGLREVAGILERSTSR
jgi:integrase